MWEKYSAILFFNSGLEAVVRITRLDDRRALRENSNGRIVRGERDWWLESVIVHLKVRVTHILRQILTFGH